ncbi:hypothetical protein QEH57_04640 [Pelagicoccus sp. SDUM812005]|nr:hypothetical protein [Pelagicoccus sp. SDUM812005]
MFGRQVGSATIQAKLTSKDERIPGGGSSDRVVPPHHFAGGKFNKTRQAEKLSYSEQISHWTNHR